MPQNVTKRLQKLENELKTVLNIYNAADKSRKNLENEMHVDHLIPSVNPHKNADNQNSKPVKSPERFHSKIPTAKKPSSAPSSSGMSTISEEDQFSKHRYLIQNFGFRKNKNEMQPIDSFDNAEWYDCSTPVDLSMSASKTLTMAQEVLEKNHYYCKDVEQENPQAKNPEGDKKTDSPQKLPTSKEKTRSPGKIIKNKNMTELLPPKKLVKKKSNTLTENKANRTVSWVGSIRPPEYSDGSKPKRPFSANLKKRAPSPLVRPEGGKKDGTSEKSNEQLNSIVSRHSRGRSASSLVGAKENEKAKTASKSKEKIVTFEKSKTKREDNASEASTDSSKLRNASPAKEFKSHLPQRRKDTSDGETDKKIMKEVLQENGERLEELRRSKNLALGVAKQLKEKYDEMKDSKQELFERFRKIQEKNEDLQRELRTIMEEKLRLQLQIEGLRRESQTMLQQHEIKWSDLMQENAMLKERYKDMEKLYKEEIAERDVRIKQLLKERFTLESLEVTKLVQKKTTEYQSLLEKQEETNKDLIERINILEGQLQAARDKEKRYSEAKNEMSKQAAEVREELKRLAAEKSELESTVENLRSCLDYSQKQLDKLESKSKKQEQELQFQMKQLQQKTERLEDTNKELELIQKNSKDLEEQVKTLRQSIENFDKLHQSLVQRTIHYEQQMKKDGEEKEKLKKDLEKEKDSLLIKNKIIEDQQETIKQLRDKAEEAKSVLKKNESLERIINIEREEKLQLEEMVEHLNWRKEELKKKIKSLEEDLLVAPKEVVQDLQKTQTVLQELENQVQEKQKEWELHLQTLLKEKERACNVAEYATKKLMETTNEFQKQSEINKRLQRALAEALAERDRHIKAEHEKANNVRIKEIMSELHPDMKIRNSPRRYNPVESDEEAEWLHKKIHLRSPKRHKSRGLHSEPRTEDPSQHFYREDYY